MSTLLPMAKKVVSNQINQIKSLENNFSVRATKDIIPLK